jgi:vacuolar protein sorting-associated protein 13A/C
MDLLIHFGISFVDIPQEISYLFFDGLYVSFKTSNQTQFFELVIDNIQIDNQTYDSNFPVVLTSKREKQNETLHLSIIKKFIDSSFEYYPNFELLLRESKISIDMDFLFLLVKFIEKLTISTDEEDEEKTDNLLNIVERVDITDNKKIYFKKLKLNSMKLNVTFKFGKINEDIISKYPILLYLESIGIFLINIDDCSVKFNMLELNNPFLTQTELIDKIWKHYYSALTSEMYKIIGSFEIIGNPIGLFRYKKNLKKLKN